MKRQSTAYRGVFFREVRRLGGPGAERVYYIVYTKDDRVVEEKVGRQYADAMTPAKAARIRADRIEGRRPSRKEIREANKAESQQWTVNRLWNAYRESLQENPAKSKKALSVDANRYERFINPTFGNREPANIQPLDVERLRRELQKTPAKLRGEKQIPRTLSPATVKATLTLLKRIVSYGAKTGLSPALPFKIAMPRVSNIVIEDLNDEQVKRFFAAIEADPNLDARDIMRLALFTGMRRGELFKLKWEDIDFERGFIRIIGPKGGTDQVIPMNVRAREVLQARPRTSDYIFPGKDGGRRTSFQKALRRIRDAAGLPKSFRPLHGLRHAYASMLASSGEVDLYTLQRLLTHKSPAMTQRYAHLRDDALKRAGAVIDRLLFNSEGKQTDESSEKQKNDTPHKTKAV